MTARRAVRTVLAAYDEHDVLTYASAIAFQLAFALIPLTLVGLALLGVFDLDEIWTKHVAPDLRHNVSRPVFQVFDETVRQVIGAKRYFWVTLGVVLTIWEVSGATRGVMGVLDRIYEIRRKRPFWERIGVSLVLATVATVLGLLAVGMLEFGSGLVNTVIGGGIVVGVVAGIVRWALALAALALLLALIVRYAPAVKRPWHLVTRGSALTIAGWIGVSFLFGLYLREIADYGSIFGNLATVIIAFEYLYLSAIVLLTGLIVDRLGIGQCRRRRRRSRAARR